MAEINVIFTDDSKRLLAEALEENADRLREIMDREIKRLVLSYQDTEGISDSVLIAWAPTALVFLRDTLLPWLETFDPEDLDDIDRQTRDLIDRAEGRL